MPIVNSSPVTLLASATRTTSGTVNGIPGCAGVRLFLDITAVSGASPQLTVTVYTTNGDDGIGGFAAKTGTGSDELTIYPGIAESANRAVARTLPFNWYVGYAIDHSVTFSLSAVPLV